MLSGWVGSLATRTEDGSEVFPFISVGICGAILGGAAASWLGMTTMQSTADVASIFNALFLSAVFVVCFGLLISQVSKHNNQH